MNHSLLMNLMEEMKKVATCLHDRPRDIKKRNSDVAKGSGYTHLPVNPLYENMGFNDFKSSLEIDNFCCQLDASPHDKEIMKVYGEAIQDLAIDLSKKIKESVVGFSEPMDFKDWRCNFKMNKYSFTPETVGISGVHEHTDPGFVTVVQDDELIDGLEILHPPSGSFVPVPPLPGTFLANLGDVAHVWSNGRFQMCMIECYARLGRQEFQWWQVCKHQGIGMLKLQKSLWTLTALLSSCLSVSDVALILVGLKI